MSWAYLNILKQNCLLRVYIHTVELLLPPAGGGIHELPSPKYLTSTAGGHWNYWPYWREHPFSSWDYSGRFSLTSGELKVYLTSFIHPGYLATSMKFLSLKKSNRQKYNYLTICRVVCRKMRKNMKNGTVEAKLAWVIVRWKSKFSSHYFGWMETQ